MLNWCVSVLIIEGFGYILSSAELAQSSCALVRLDLVSPLPSLVPNVIPEG